MFWYILHDNKIVLNIYGFKIFRYSESYQLTSSQFIIELICRFYGDGIDTAPRCSCSGLVYVTLIYIQRSAFLCSHRGRHRSHYHAIRVNILVNNELLYTHMNVEHSLFTFTKHYTRTHKNMLCLLSINITYLLPTYSKWTVT